MVLLVENLKFFHLKFSVDFQILVYWKFGIITLYVENKNLVNSNRKILGLQQRILEGIALYNKCIVIILLI